MKQKIVFVETLGYVVENFRKHLRDDDECYVLTKNKNANYSVPTYYVDVRTEFSEAIQIIKTNIGNPSIIITTNEMFQVSCNDISNYFDLNTNPHAISPVIRSKQSMKEIWDSKGVNTASGCFYQSIKQLEEDKNRYTFPLIIKPTSAHASCGVKKVNNPSELIAQAKKISMINSLIKSKEVILNNGFIVEQFLDGEEFSVDTIWYRGSPILTEVLSKGSLPGPFFPDRLYYLDPNLPEELKEMIVSVSYDAITACGIKDGATHTEIRFKNDIPYVLETTNRPGAGGAFYDIFKRQSNNDFYLAFYELIIKRNDNFLKELNNNSETIDKSKSYFWYNIPPSGSGIIDNVENIDSLKNHEGVIEIIYDDFRGQSIYEDDLNLSYFCCVLGQYNNNSPKRIEEFVTEFDEILQIQFR